MVGKSHCFVCCEQYWLLYIPGLCSMNKTGWYITQFFLSWTVIVGISPSFFVVDKIGWYINRISLLWTILVVISPGFVCYEKKLQMKDKTG